MEVPVDEVRGEKSEKDLEPLLECGPVSRGSRQREWLAFSLTFGLVEGAMATSITYASTFLGSVTSGMTLAIYYGCYTASTLVVAEGYVEKYGSRAALLAGFGAYVALLTSFVLNALAPGVGFLLVVLGSMVGGIGAGLVWVAQTMHYAACAQQETNWYATLFASVYVTVEALLKIGIAGILYFGSTQYLAVITLLGIAISGYVALATLPLGLETFRPTTSTAPLFRFDNATRVARAHLEEPLVACLAPFPLAFGFSSSFFTDWMTVKVSRRLGHWAVGVASALTTVSAGATSLALVVPTRLAGLGAVATIAVSTYATTALLIAITSASGTLFQWPELVSAFALQGANRAIFENSTKYYYAESCRTSPFRDPALASIYFYVGLASSVSFATLDTAIVATAVFVFFGFALAMLGAHLAASHFRSSNHHHHHHKPTTREGAPLLLDTPMI